MTNLSDEGTAPDDAQGGTLLSTRDDARYKTHVDIARLFGKDYKGHQASTFRIDDATRVWFPKLYPNSDWDNQLSPDGQVLTMRHQPGGRFENVLTSPPLREYVITFAHVKPDTGPKYYRFIGVFEALPHLSDTTKWVYQFVSDTVHIDDANKVTFSPTRTRPELDDQSAEAADADPALIADLKQQLESGKFEVEDLIGTTRSRGSAQSVFAKRVKDNYGWECAVTGIRTSAFLVASHIVPWSEDKTIRLDPSNGICLSTFVDRAFDAGFVTITPQGRTAVRWDRVAEDPILSAELAKIDDVELAKPSAAPPDLAKLERRLALGY
ncbi:HNH endonuclease [Isoptericola sp. NPDC019482]|uniref:HNH endonuclease n=1 Tax=Isoptericola sp. NPDC019482 TaxID=3154688 RepID=UPI00346D6D94